MVRNKKPGKKQCRIDNQYTSIIIIAALFIQKVVSFFFRSSVIDYCCSGILSQQVEAIVMPILEKERLDMLEPDEAVLEQSRQRVKMQVGTTAAVGG